MLSPFALSSFSLSLCVCVWISAMLAQLHHLSWFYRDSTCVIGRAVMRRGGAWLSPGPSVCVAAAVPMSCASAVLPTGDAERGDVAMVGAGTSLCLCFHGDSRSSGSNMAAVGAGVFFLSSAVLDEEIQTGKIPEMKL